MIIDQTELQGTELAGQVAIVTGAGQGIGRETARILAHVGAAVVIAEINPSGQETEDLIQREGGRARYIQTDVSDPQSMEQLQQQVHQVFGTVDMLLNNAITFTTKPLLEHTVEEWDRVMAVNLRGAFLGIKLFLPEMLKRGRGVIVTMQSEDGLPYLAPYAASKAGLHSLAASLAQELGEQSGVSVYCFGAGMVDTPSGMVGFRYLAPRYGMGLEEFMKLGPGGRVISAELCATGLVGTILHAADLHGQETLYTMGLAKLGLTPTGERLDKRPEQIIHPSSISPELLSKALRLNRQLEAIVETNLREFADQPLLVRPIAKRIFQQRTSLKVEDWLALAQEMTRRLEGGPDAEQDATRALEPGRVNTYLVHLRRMEEYLTKSAVDARGWITDQAQLEAALEALQTRRETVQQLIAALKELEQQEPIGIP
jgi:NAD(P)-dependent dehydrogenase (short-subunit alcohol dehydrogenase family)